MKRWLVLFGMLLPAVGWCFDTGSFFFRARYLVETCESESNAKYNECVAYLASVADTADAVEAVTGAQSACVPTGVSLAELRKVLLDYQEHHPELLHGSAAALAVNAYQEAWTCPPAPGVSSSGRGYQGRQPSFTPTFE
jgi:hypothetical protein